MIGLACRDETVLRCEEDRNLPIGIRMEDGAVNDFGVLVAEFIKSAKEKARDGLSLAEAGQLFVALAQMAVVAAQELANPGPEKKSLVREALSQLYDAVEPHFPIPFWLKPFWVFLKSPVKTSVLAIADGAIEAIYAYVKGA